MLWNVPEHDRNRELEEDEVAAGLHWPPDDSTDHGEPFEGVPEGHGTQTAMLAGGMRTGVARRAGLYLIKAGGAVLDREDNVVEEDVCADSLVISLNHIVGKLADGSLPVGKTVILIDTRKLARERSLGSGAFTLHCPTIAEIAMLTTISLNLKSGTSIACQRTALERSRDTGNGAVMWSRPSTRSTDSAV